MARPATVPTWATSGTRTAPAGGQQASGWLSGDQVPASLLNWLQGIAGDWFTWLNTFAPAKDEANTWAATQSLQGATALDLTAVADQVIRKSSEGLLTLQNQAGNLVVTGAGDVTLSSSGGELDIDSSSGSIVCNSNRLSLVANPTSDSDADTQGARNAAIALETWADLTPATGWTAGSSPYQPQVSRQPSSGLVFLRGFVIASAGHSNGDPILTLPAGYRPPTARTVPLVLSVASSTTHNAAFVLINTDGVVSIRQTFADTDYLYLDGLVLST